MKRLLVLAPAPSLAASTRFRLVQFEPALRAAGVQMELRPFLDEQGFQVLYAGGQQRKKAQAAVHATLGRLRDLIVARGADGVLIHREAALVGPPLLEWAIARVLHRPVIFDFDDAIWVPYASPTYGDLLSRLLKVPSKTDSTLGWATRVIAGNDYLAEYASRFNSCVDVIPTVVDTTVFVPAPSTNPVPVLGWIGTHSTSRYLQDLAPALQRLAARRRFVLRVIGGSVTMPGVDVVQRPWSLAREVSDFQGLDVGLYPLNDDAWAVGKSGFKAVQYMACGIPVVGSPVGVTSSMIVHGETGFLARTEDEWVNHLERLIGDVDLRRSLGAAARGMAQERWSLATHAPRFVQAVTTALGTHCGQRAPSSSA